MRPSHSVLVIPFALLAACGDDVAASDAGADATSMDAAVAFDTGPADASEDAPDATPATEDAGPRSCADLLAPDLEIDVDPDGPDTQIHAALAFDGESAIWVAYARPEGDSGLFDVWARRFGCDGAPLGDPFLVQTSSAGNDIDPEIAIGPGGVLIAWTTDDGSGGTANLQIRYRRLARDGTPRGETHTLRTERDGAPVPDNHYEQKLAATTDGFVVAGARALADVMRFQAFAQPLDAAGALAGATLDPLHENGVTQGNAAIAARSAIDGWIAFEREPDGGDTSVMLGRLDGSAAPEPAAASPRTSRSPSLALDATDGSRVWLAYAGEMRAGDSDVWIVDGSRPSAERASIQLGLPRRVDHSPRVVADDRGGGALAWYRNTSGIRNELWVARFASGPGALDLRAGVPVSVAIDVPPYEPAIAFVSGDVFVLAWSQGTSPAFRMRARFVELSTP